MLERIRSLFRRRPTAAPASHHPDLEGIRDLATGELEPSKLLDILRHLDGCEQCRQHLETIILLRLHRDLFAEACSRVARRARTELEPPRRLM